MFGLPYEKFTYVKKRIVTISSFRYHSITVACAALLIVLFIASGLLGIHHHTSTKEFDTVAYLSEAMSIQQLGPVGFLTACIDGSYRFANRHPLYLFLLSPITAHHPSAFISAKKLTFTLGIVFILLFFYGVYRLYGRSTAALATFLLVTNASFIRLSTMVACEVLLVICLSVCWFFIVRGFDNNKFWIYAGIFAGLSYLTKGTGLLMPAVFIGSLVILFKKDVITQTRNRFMWLFFGGFFIVTSFYITRNIVSFGTPFYSINTYHLWIDSWQETYRPDFYLHPPTFLSYFHKHGFSGFMTIIGEAFLKRGPRLLALTLQPLPVWRADGFSFIANPNNVPLYRPWALLLISLSGFGWWQTRKEEKVVSFLTVGSIYCLVSWYTKMADVTRFFLPLIPFIYLYAARGMLKTIGAVTSKSRLIMPGARLICCGIFLWVGGNIAVHHSKTALTIDTSYRFPKSYPYLLAWMTQTVQTDELCFLSSDFAGPLFYCGDLATTLTTESWPQLETLEALKSYIQEHAIRYGVLDIGSISHRRKIFQNYFTFDTTAGLTPLQPISGFTLLGRDPQPPGLFVIYKFEWDKF